MQSPVESPTRVSFGLYEADLQSGELWKAGHRIKIQSQPFKVLSILLERPGEVVSREELQERLWGKDTIVDFDHSLGTAINKIREALSDSADNPRFVETLARRGYRFIAPVSYVAPTATKPAVAPATTVTVVEAPALTAQDASKRVLFRTKRAQNLLIWGAVTAVLAAVGLGFYFVFSPRSAEPDRITQLTHDGRISPGAPAMESFPSAVTDGVRIFTGQIENGRTILSQVFVNTGETTPLSVPSELAAPSLGDLSPDGSKLLLRSHLSPESEQPLWVIPTGGGSALRVANIKAHDATWMPDGSGILYAAGSQLFITHLQDGTSTPFADLPVGRAFWLRWSPDGKVLRFTVLDPIAHTQSLWELDANSRIPKPLLSNWSKPAAECCGVWTPDGKFYIFQSSHDGNTDLWRYNGHSEPTRITNGPLDFQAPVAARNGHRIFFLGLDSRSELQRFNHAQKEFLPERTFLTHASRVSYSRDGQWVAWTDPQGRLWRARLDGTEKIQLTPDAMQVFLAQWSPDNQQLALMARQPGKAWQLYSIQADGGSPTPLLQENRNAADPSWSADGKLLVFGRVTDLMGMESTPRNLQILNLATHATQPIPNSEGYFSPRWSPDGRYIAAISLDQRRLVLYDVAARTWKTLAMTSVADPVWSSDSKAIYLHAFMANTQPIYRVSVPEGKLEEVASLTSFRTGDIADYFFSGITPDNVPLVRARMATGNLYMLDLDGK
ncbi:winged helix-turn-helix domain-containing protein [Terriglobus tenax]|uniref:winged helix-turn-helix domain-containing protein n=1 Tax=Terriglobus tenax TaxID=1111115 RepID=UPI0021E02E7D|nr:winged helix-turn-helix domain-containing protein [Terriglobus tenax]